MRGRRWSGAGGQFVHRKLTTTGNFSPPQLRTEFSGSGVSLLLPLLSPGVLPFPPLPVEQSLLAWQQHLLLVPIHTQLLIVAHPVHLSGPQP